VGLFILVGVVRMGVDRRGSLLVFCFRVFRLYTTPFVCTFCFTDLYSSCAEIRFLIKFY